MYVELYSHPRDKSNLDMVCSLLMCSSVKFANILLRIFTSVYIGILIDSFPMVSLSGFSIIVMLASQNEFRSIPSSSIPS